MAKRFRDTALWDKDWYVGLTCAERCAVDYIFCRCDAVGVWAPAFNTADKLIGEKVDWDSLPGKVNGNIKVLSNGKWWLSDFCKYQYGKISQNSVSKVQQSLYSLLISHGLWDAYVATLSPTVDTTVQDKDKEKEKEKVKVKEESTLRRATDFYQELYVKELGIKPTWDGKIIKLLKADLARLEYDEWQKLVQSFFFYPTDFVVKNSTGFGYNIFHSLIDQLVMREKNRKPKEKRKEYDMDEYEKTGKLKEKKV